MFYSTENDDESTLLVIGGAEMILQISASSSDTIHNLKCKIKQVTGVNMTRQSLWRRGTKLRDERSIEDYGIDKDIGFFLTLNVTPSREEFEIDVEPKSLTLLSEDLGTLTLSGGLVGIWKGGFRVSESWTVLKLKETIVGSLREVMEENGVRGSVEAGDISLYRLDCHMQDGRTLSDYYVKHRCTVQMYVMGGSFV